VSDNETDGLTHHAMLVAWGQFAQSIGLIQAIEGVSLHQKAVTHRPQTKILEFFVAILAGLAHLKDLSRSAHPIDQDPAVAKAWLQSAWADYSGVSRTLTTLHPAEAEQIAGVLDKIAEPILAGEVMKALQLAGRLTYDGDLTGRPVSNSSTTYPNAGYGHMDNALRLGYQAAMVSAQPDLWSSVAVGGSSARQLGLERPSRSHGSGCGGQDRLASCASRGPAPRSLAEHDPGRRNRDEQVQAIDAELKTAQAQEAETRQQMDQQRALVIQLEAEYREKQRPERPYSTLGRARYKLGVLQRRQARLVRKMPKLTKQLDRRKGQFVVCQAQEWHLQRRLEQFETENRANRYPIQADFRLDAGFGVRENVALLIEMGYEVYTKPYSDWLTPRLKRWAGGRRDWTRVGKNAEMIAWKAATLHDFPYPLDVALEHFWVGGSQKHATLVHFGGDPVTSSLSEWFERYNARQTIEAGKEGKGVFEMHHLKVRSAPGLYLQEQLAAFAANFVRWAAHWLATQCPQLPAGWQDTTQPKVKEQVKVGAHTSAWVHWQEQGCLSKFTDASVSAGRSLELERQWAVQLPLPFRESL